MSRRHWALVVALVLVNYIVFASLISVVVGGRGAATAEPTPIPLPTFTPMPSPTPIALLPTFTPAPTDTPTPVVAETPPAENQAPTQIPTPVFTGPYTQVDVTLNVRSGPGTEYAKVGSVPPGAAVEITGRNADSSWWQIRYSSAPGGVGWVSSEYGTAYKIEEIPLVEAPAPPPTAAPAALDATAPAESPSAEDATPAPQPEQPQYQFTPAAWYAGEPNAAIGRFYGHLKDAASGVMVNGYSIRATCGDFAVLSFPTGPSPVAPDWEAGWYDIVISTPVTCNWTLQVVEYQCGGSGFDAQCTQFRPLSEAVPVSTSVEKGETIIVADWTKNW